MMTFCLLLNYVFFFIFIVVPGTGNYYGTPKPPLDSPLVLPAAPLAQSSSAGLHQLQQQFQQQQQQQQQQSESLFLLAGAHPSSEGKRRRNRSNVEAMAAAQNDGGGDSSGPDPSSGHGGVNHHHIGSGRNAPGTPNPMNTSSNNIINNNNNMSIPSYREDGGGAMGGLSEAELGPLPQNWEKAYTERGEVYFIE